MKAKVPQINSIEQLTVILTDPKQYAIKVKELQNFQKMVEDSLGKLAKKDAIEKALATAKGQRTTAANLLTKATLQAEAIVVSANAELRTAEGTSVEADEAKHNANELRKQAAKHLSECDERCAQREAKLISGENRLLAEQSRLQDGRKQLKADILSMAERVKQVNEVWNG